MIAWLADEDFHGHIVRALLLRQPDIDLLRVQDVELMGADDADILSWCADDDRILLTHDRATVPEQAYARVEANQPMAASSSSISRWPTQKLSTTFSWQTRAASPTSGVGK